MVNCLTVPVSEPPVTAAFTDVIICINSREKQGQVYYPFGVRERNITSHVYEMQINPFSHARGSLTEKHGNSLMYSSAPKDTHKRNLWSVPHGHWSWSAINCAVLSVWPRPATGSWVKVVGWWKEEGGNKREGVLDQLSLQGKTPWSAQCVAGATHTVWDASFTGIFGFICPG